MNNPVAQLAVNWLTIVPFTVHSALQQPTAAEFPRIQIVCCSSCVIVNYNTTSQASNFFFQQHFPPGRRTKTRQPLSNRA